MNTTSTTLPANWRDLYEPATFTVGCNGETHTVEWTPDAITCVDHNLDADLALEILGAEPPTCVEFQRLMQKQSVDGDTYVRQLYSYDLDKYLPDTSQHDAALSRMSAIAVVRDLATSAALRWLDAVGADTTEALITVKFTGDPDRVGFRAGWGPQCRTRVVMFVTESYYTTVYTHGDHHHGRLVVGELDGQLIVAGDPTYDPASGWAAWGVPADGTPATRATTDLEADADATADQRQLDDGYMTVVSRRDFSYDDENYYPTEGCHPAFVTWTRTDAIGHVQCADVSEFYDNDDPLDYLYFDWEEMLEHGGELLDSFDTSEQSPGALLALVSKNGIDPNLLAANTWEYVVVPMMGPTSSLPVGARGDHMGCL